jgi:uncharacterized protein (TIGR02145 family)
MKKSINILLLLITITLYFGCKKDEPAKLAVVSTTPVTNITGTTATSGGNVTSDGGAAITAKGVCWGTVANPSTADSKSTDGTATGQFVSAITGLVAGTIYHIRAYVANSVGTAYGSDLSFTTLGKVPLSVTQPATKISVAEATLNGSVNANDLSTTVTFEYGSTVSYGNTATATQSPVTGNIVTIVSEDISGLSAGTTYHFRVKAVNSVGTTFGDDITFTTNQTDIDGNIYHTIAIGTQVWMKENLKTTKYNDGTAIPNITDNTAWVTLNTGAYSDYSNTPANSTTYGRLYNWYVVDNNAATKVASNGGKNVCPTGWHVPGDAEWTTLTTSLGGESVAGGKLKEIGLTHWLTPNIGATNEMDFTALPGGTRNEDGTCDGIGIGGDWWSSTEYSAMIAWGRYMIYNDAVVPKDDVSKIDGISVRCVRDF